MIQRVIHAVMAFSFVATLLGMGIWFFAQTVEDIQSTSWPRIEGTVVSCQVFDHASGKHGTSYRVAVQYDFSIAGKNYRGNRFSNDFNIISHDEITDDLAKEFRKGSPCSVAYKPADPTRNCLRTISNGRLWLRLCISFICGLVGITALVYGGYQTVRKNVGAAREHSQETANDTERPCTIDSVPSAEDFRTFPTN